MKRRLRKKRHLGEFREFGFQVDGYGSIDMTDDEQNTLLDACIEFVESINLSIGGTVGKRIGFFASRLCTRRRCLKCNRRFGRDRILTPVTDTDRDAVKNWFASKGIEVTVGPLEDVWHGPTEASEIV